MALQSSRRTPRSPSSTWPPSRWRSPGPAADRLPVCLAVVLLVSLDLAVLGALAFLDPARGPAGLARPADLLVHGRLAFLALRRRRRSSEPAGGRVRLEPLRGLAYGRSGLWVRPHRQLRLDRSGYGYGYRSWRHGDWAYGVYVDSNSSDSSGCYYADKYNYRLGGYRRVWTCSE